MAKDNESKIPKNNETAQGVAAILVWASIAVVGLGIWGFGLLSQDPETVEGGKNVEILGLLLYYAGALLLITYKPPK